MQEKTIYKISLVVMVCGLFFLYFYADNVDLKSVDKLDSSMTDETVSVVGEIERISVAEKATFIKLSNVEKVRDTEVILFPEGELFIVEGDVVEVSGTVEEYNDQQEIIADKIVKK